MTSMAMRRILKLSQKNRKQRSVHIEEDIFKVIKDNRLPLSDITNVALERFLKDEGLIKP